LFVLRDGVAKQYIVSVGEPIGAGLHLLDGPPAGSKVIIDPPVELQDGQAIKQKEE
jgi:hypothetical protein